MFCGTIVFLIPTNKNRFSGKFLAAQQVSAPCHDLAKKVREIKRPHYSRTLQCCEGVLGITRVGKLQNY